eukprot:jgi/Mesen1/8157/ME000438S07272
MDVSTESHTRFCIRLGRRAQEEQEMFLTPTEDESSKEVLAFISRLNLPVHISKPGGAAKAKPGVVAGATVQLPAGLHLFGLSDQRSQSGRPSFLARATSASAASTSVGVLRPGGGGSNSRSSFVLFGRDDSNSTSLGGPPLEADAENTRDAKGGRQKPPAAPSSFAGQIPDRRQAVGKEKGGVALLGMLRKQIESDKKRASAGGGGSLFGSGGDLGSAVGLGLGLGSGRGSNGKDKRGDHSQSNSGISLYDAMKSIKSLRRV